jgi:AcrR family transcriptional regulator
MLAERAGVAPGLVHYHFDSVQDLLRRAALGSIRELLEAVTATFGELTARDAVTAMVRSLDGFPGNDPTTLLVSEAYLAATRDAELRTRLADEVIRFRGALSSLFADAGDPDAEATAATLAATLDGLMLHRALGAGAPTDSVTRVALRLLDGRVA